MDRWVGSIAIVTGVSSGIGESICEKLVDTGLKVVGIARRKEKLNNLANKLVNLKGEFYPYPGDVSREEDLLNAFQWTKINVGPVSVLINNAGIIHITPFEESKTNDFINVLKVNTLAPFITSREALKQMEESKIDGIIININSTAGKSIRTTGSIHMYQASKYALTALTDSLRTELTNKGSKIRVTGIYPGGVETEMMAKIMAAIKRNKPLLKAEDVANAVMFVLSTPQHVQIADLMIKAVGEI